MYWPRRKDLPYLWKDLWCWFLGHSYAYPGNTTHNIICFRCRRWFSSWDDCIRKFGRAPVPPEEWKYGS